MSPRRRLDHTAPPGTPRDDRVKVETCRCRQPVLRALVWCRDIRADPTPIDERQELAVLLAGRWTFELHLSPWPGNTWLGYRTQWHITDTTTNPILAEHDCPAKTSQLVVPRGIPPPTRLIPRAIPQPLF